MNYICSKIVFLKKIKKSNHHNLLTPWYYRLFGEKTELIFSISSGVFWSLGLALSFKDGTFLITTNLYILACFLGGFFTFITAGKDLLNGKFEIDFLMLFAAIGAGFLGKWGEGALLLFLFSLGHALEHYAMKRARKSIAALSELSPSVAIIKRNGILTEIFIEKLKLNDIIVVKPNSKIAADGVIIKGTSSVNQASITGESIPVDKYPSLNRQETKAFKNLLPEERVFAGTINGTGVLDVRVLKTPKDSTLARIIALVKESESQKSPTQHFTDKFEKYYVPIVLIIVLVLMFAFLILNETFQDSFYRAISVLIAASPCALAISTPSAVLAGIARAARQGVLFKGGLPLEELGNIRAIAFDKTGTLTLGQPTLTHVIPFGNNSKENMLKVTIAVERLSDHPLASAIVNKGISILGDIDIPIAENITSLTARGIKAQLNNKVVHIGNRLLFKELTGENVPLEIEEQMSELELQGHTVMIVHQDGMYLGIISVMDLPRPSIKRIITSLKQLGINKMIMLTGDHQKVAESVAKKIGITHPLGNLLPKDKVIEIEKLKLEIGNVAMIGDGVNDAPAMAKSTIGIAMGAAGSDVALETADIALMADKLDNLPFAIGLSRKANRIIKQNLFISLGMVAVLVPLTILGTVSIGPAVVGHEGSTLLVVLNALRLLNYKY